MMGSEESEIPSKPTLQARPPTRYSMWDVCGFHSLLCRLPPQLLSTAVQKVQNSSHVVTYPDTSASCYESFYASPFEPVQLPWWNTWTYVWRSGTLPSSSGSPGFYTASTKSWGRGRNFLVPCMLYVYEHIIVFVATFYCVLTQTYGCSVNKVKAHYFFITLEHAMQRESPKKMKMRSLLQA